MDEQIWIEKILAGDAQSFSCLVAKYQQMAFNIAFQITGNREEAEEVVQDSFVKAYHALASFRFGSKFSTWFYKIVYNTSITAQRRQSSSVSYEDIHSVDITAEETDNAIKLLEREERKEIIQKALKKLPTDEALILSLYYLEECSVEDIRQITDLTLSNVKVKLFRGRKRFYEILKLMVKHEIHNLL
ncbi:RNA polymerase sigma factor (sigma-70 family) [Parabacteroides sp. PF5-5]|uniref:RNA polymerase sigma factor n=1 Tax=unclassified Parabacteroides TaxID=2649774 RepID=UPI00247537BB|nr:MULTISPECIES: RNA polymerase sigma factor [unclassified Parabacteroides]MDH6307022.1 RNA polymerase sigma factor (sigma-70 family) [Parabacteroides sp. PH5-39]MDH6317937.1 RNA polymerase sigma factor (sigma-70 family) [Parabacteroides sp. PF5-13]MDH6321659.1 RNA polymerase sigma factor (sigma-70 family) [Parabacteroides sp. PH5-13]MDH6325410.1 RNA polymerase sigma factor (sigma-70 family) [Parabacteroides sp. PH5-8]MDH6329125.1 RNA polymerase sigma factor (sigma-70 family) [Parabacteroides 